MSALSSASEVDFVECGSAAAAQTIRQETVVFAVDCSGSMGVTQEVRGTVPFLVQEKEERAALAPTPSSSSSSSSLLQASTDRPLAEQRLPREQRDATHVSRMACARAALRDQIKALIKAVEADDGGQETVRVTADLVTFNGSVTLIGDGTGRELQIEGNRLTDATSSARPRCCSAVHHAH